MRNIRAVIDTNIIVSGVISPKGLPRKILELARKKVFQPVTSLEINREILEADMTLNLSQIVNYKK